MRTDVLYQARAGMPIADLRGLWDGMVEDAKLAPGIRHVLFLPQDARLESPLLKTSFTNRDGGVACITVGEHGRWKITSQRLRRWR